ncbi:hypothetical protein ACFQX6_67350 [Streptosporangium lutulentum]
MIFTWWAKTPTSVFQAPLSQGEQGSGPVQFLTTHTQWYVAAVAVFGLLIAAGRLAIQRRAEPAVSALTGLVVLVVVSAVGAAMVMAASQAADSYSSWILDQASQGEGSWSATITRYTSLTGMAAGSTTLGKALPGPLTLVLALLGLITGLVQIVLMLIRTAMLGLLTGLLPLVASMASTEQGRALGRKAGGWLVAYLLYKPVAATIYAYAISALDEPNDEITKLSGFVMIILAVVALPALMRFITPLVSATTAGGAGGVAAVGMAVATGARMVPSLGGRGRSGGAGATGTPGPSGSPPPSGARMALDPKAPTVHLHHRRPTARPCRCRHLQVRHLQVQQVQAQQVQARQAPHPVRAPHPAPHLPTRPPFQLRPERTRRVRPPAQIQLRGPLHRPLQRRPGRPLRRGARRRRPRRRADRSRGRRFTPARHRPGRRRTRGRTQWQQVNRPMATGAVPPRRASAP